MFRTGQAPNNYIIVAGRNYQEEANELEAACLRCGLPICNAASFDFTASPIDTPRAIVIWADSLEAYRRFKQYNDAFPSTQTTYVLVLPSDEPLTVTANNQHLHETYLSGQVAVADVLHAMMAATGMVTNAPLTTTRKQNVDHLGKVVVVFGAKGGVGKTMVATNLAVSLKDSRDNKVILVDSDTQHGTVADYLGIRARANGAYLLGSTITYTPKDVLDSVQSHNSGIDLLLPPAQPSLSEQAIPQAARSLVDTLRSIYDFTVIDTATCYDQILFAWLDVADEILLVATPERATLRNTANFLELAHDMGYDKKISVVLNRTNTSSNPASIPETLRQMTICNIDSFGPSVLNSFDEGVPLVLKDPSHPISIALHRLGVTLAGPPVTRRGNRLSNMLWPFNRVNPSPKRKVNADVG